MTNENDQGMLTAYDMMMDVLQELLAALEAPVFEHPSSRYVIVHVDRKAIDNARAALIIALVAKGPAGANEKGR